MGRARILLTTALVLATVAGCKNDPPPTAVPSAEITAPVKAAPEAKKPGEYRVTLEAPGPYRPGEAAVAKIHLSVEGPYKCNADYPYKFKLASADELGIAKTVIDKTAIKIDGKKAVMSVPFTPKSAGEHRLGGKFFFSYCDDNVCLMEKVDLARTIAVK